MCTILYEFFKKKNLVKLVNICLKINFIFSCNIAVYMKPLFISAIVPLISSVKSVSLTPVISSPIGYVFSRAVLKSGAT